MRLIVISLLRTYSVLGLVIIILILEILVLNMSIRSIGSTHYANIISLKRLKFFIFISIVRSCAILNNYRLIHQHALVLNLIIKTFDIFQIIYLASKQSHIICKHFPVKFFPYILFLFIFFIFLFSSIIKITIKENKLMPFFQIFLHML